MEQEVIYHSTEYKKYLKSSKYLFKPIFLLLLSLFGLTIFPFIVIDSIEKNEAIAVPLIIGLILVVTSIGLIVFSVFSFMDMIQAKVRVRVAEALRITHNKNVKSLVYNYNGNELSVGLPSKWHIQNLLPQKVKIWVTYHTKSLLRIEFLETGEVFDVNIA